MSTAHLPPAMRTNVPDQQSTVQKLLDENSRLIDIIQEYLNQVCLFFFAKKEYLKILTIPKCRNTTKENRKNC